MVRCSLIVNIWGQPNSNSDIKVLERGRTCAACLGAVFPSVQASLSQLRRRSLEDRPPCCEKILHGRDGTARLGRYWTDANLGTNGQSEDPDVIHFRSLSLTSLYVPCVVPLPKRWLFPLRCTNHSFFRRILDLASECHPTPQSLQMVNSTRSRLGGFG